MKANTVLDELVTLLRDRLRIGVLRREVTRLKAERYDQLAENIIGLRRALETQQRAADDLRHQIEDRDEQIQKLRDEYAALQARGTGDRSDTVRSERLALFRQLQTVLTQLPTMQSAIDAGADIRAADVMALIAPLEEAFRDLGFTPIGQAGAQLPYDPKRHTVVGRGAANAAPQDSVRVRYVGYMHEGDIVCKAQVTLVEQKTTQTS